MSQSYTAGRISRNAARPSVVLSHAGVQHSYQTAFALQETRLLRAFWTTIYHNGVTQRHHEDLQKDLIHSNPWPEVFQRGCLALVGRNNFTVNHLLYWRNRWFDGDVARQLGKASFDCFIGYSGSCRASLRKAKELGKLTIVDQHDIHPKVAEDLLKEEVALHPDFLPLIPYWPPHRDYLKCVEEEFEVADRIIVSSSFSLNTHLAGGISRYKLIRVPYGVRPPKSFFLFDKRQNPFRILFVGTVTQRKGIKYLLEAVKQLRLRESELILIGQIDGRTTPLRSYRDFFEHVGFLSPRDLKAYLGSSHVLILPSIYDSFGLVILEAMVHGVPVIVSENTVGRDIVRKGIDGYIVPIRDVEALKERILQLYQNRDLCEEMGRNARKRAEEFTWERYRQEIATSLETLMISFQR